MSEVVVIKIIESPVSVAINVTEVLGRNGEQGPAGDGHTHLSEGFTNSTNPEKTLSQNYIAGPGNIKVFRNGARLGISEYNETAANKITLTVQPILEDEIIIDFKYLP